MHLNWLIITPLAPKTGMESGGSIMQKHYGNTEIGMRPGAEKFPLMVVQSMTYACNSKCPNCPYRTNPAIRKSYADAMHIDDNLFRMIALETGDHGAILRLTGGGEPMMHPHIVPLICDATSYGAKVAIITNGSDKDVAWLVHENIFAIEFSIDAGCEEEYNVVRAGLSWDTVNLSVKIAKRARDLAGMQTKLIVSIINQNGVDIERAKKYWQPHCDVVQVRKYLTWGLNDPSHSADATPYLPPCERVPCPWLFERINIDTRGKVTYCGEDIAFEHAFADVHDRSIADIWLGPEMQAMRDAHLNRTGDAMPMCAKCPDWQYRSWDYNYWSMTKDKA